MADSGSAAFASNSFHQPKLRHKHLKLKWWKSSKKGKAVITVRDVREDGKQPESNGKKPNFFTNLFTRGIEEKQSHKHVKSTLGQSQSENILPSETRGVNYVSTSQLPSSPSMDLDRCRSTTHRLGFTLVYTGSQIGAIPILSPSLLVHGDSAPIDSSSTSITVPLASTESLSEGSVITLIKQDSFIEGEHRIPVIHEELVTPSSSTVDFHREDDGVASPAGLLSPADELNESRKSSSGDSAVDLKFSEEDTAYPPPVVSPPLATVRQNSLVEKEALHNVDIKKNLSRTSSTASWRKIRTVVTFIPFIQKDRSHKYPWIQLAGHEGNFRSGDQGTILKKFCKQECESLNLLMTDSLKKFVPQFMGEVEKDGENNLMLEYIRMEDLLKRFDSPSLMDCKMGVRTYLEEELSKAKENPKPRKDMYEKMMDVDKSEPSQEEHASMSVTKPRYMQWRETISSTSHLGFRIEGVKGKFGGGNDGSEKNKGTSTRDFKTTKERGDVQKSLEDFTDSNIILVERYLTRLLQIQQACEESDFLKSHECIGSSLLLVHDHTQKTGVWLIDFGKTVPHKPGLKVNHRDPWIEGNHEDGYLTGLDNLIGIFTTVYIQLGGCNSFQSLLEDCISDP